MRVLVTGMGGELGTRVAQLLEEETRVTEIVLDPVRRKLGIEARVVDLSLIVVFFGSIFFGTLIIEILRKLAVGLGG